MRRNGNAQVYAGERIFAALECVAADDDYAGKIVDKIIECRPSRKLSDLIADLVEAAVRTRLNRTKDESA